MEKNEDGKNVINEIGEIMTEIKQVEKAYNEMGKKELVELLVTKRIHELCSEPEETSCKLWYFVSDKTGAKFLTNEEPKKVYSIFDASGDDMFYLTDGEINIRVPVMLEKTLPDIKYGDEPVLVKLSFEF